MAGPDPAISLEDAWCLPERDHRDKPGDDALKMPRAQAFPIQLSNSPAFALSQRSAARILCRGAGDACLSLSSPNSRGWSAERRVRTFPCRASAKKRGRLSALHGGFASRHLAETQAPGPRFSGTGLSPKSQSASSSRRGRSAPRAGPGPPGCGVTNPGRGRRIPLRLQDRL
jgi:hypothetical protein